jgi:hypothetical protein
MNRPILQKICGLAIIALSVPIVMFGGRELGERLLQSSSLDSGSRAMIAACIAVSALSVLLWMLQFVPGVPGFDRPLRPIQKIGLLGAPITAILYTIYQILFDH